MEPIRTDHICIFDLDGTLLNTLESLWYTVNRTLTAIGLPEISKDSCRRFVGNGVDYLIRHSVIEAGDPEARCFDEAKRVYLETFQETCTYKVEDYPGLRAQLFRLREQGYRLAVLTNKPQKMAERVIKTAFGDDLFCIVMGQDDSRPRKPDPAGVYAILDRAKIERENACYIGDSETDQKTGRNAGLPTITVTWGFRLRKDLLKDEPAYLLDHPEQLSDLVTQIFS